MAIQTLLFIGAARSRRLLPGAGRRRVAEAKLRAEAQVAELRAYLDRMSATVDETARALRRGTAAVDDVMTDVRDAMGTVRNSVGTVASAVIGAARRARARTLAGIQFWRKRRAAQRDRLRPRLQSCNDDALEKGEGNDKVERQESTGSGMFLLGALAGALVGAGVALLMAPKTGAEIRRGSERRLQLGARCGRAPLSRHRRSAREVEEASAKFEREGRPGTRAVPRQPWATRRRRAASRTRRSDHQC